MTTTRLTQILNSASPLQAAGGADGEDTLHIARPAFALRAEAALTPQDRLTHHPLGGVVGRLDSRVIHKRPQMRTMLDNPAAFTAQGADAGGSLLKQPFHAAPQRPHSSLKRPPRQGSLPNPRSQLQYSLRQTVEFAADPAHHAGDFAQRQEIPFQMGPADLANPAKEVISTPAVADQNTAKGPQQFSRRLLTPLGMTSSGFDVTVAPAGRRALGYRWEDAAWRLEPTMAHGAFGAMGGLQTSANDYAKYVAWLLSAWPARDGADTGPVKRASVRELAQGANFPQVRQRSGKSGAEACRQAATYGMGMYAATDCDLGLTLSHGGGYPGYGSHVLVLPDYGVGIFAFANRTYTGPRSPVWDAAVALHRAGLLKARPSAGDRSLSTAYAAVGRMYTAGSVTSVGDALAMNFLMDRSAEGWARDLASLKAQAGACDTTAPIVATGALSGDFTWRCADGRVRGSLLLAPTNPPQIQSLSLARATP